MTLPEPESVIITKSEFLAEIDQHKPCRHCPSEAAIHVDPRGTWSWDVVVLHDRGCPGLDEDRARTGPDERPTLRLIRE